MIETLREVRRQEYRRLWDSVPGALGSALLIAAVALAGWDAGVWVGLATLVLLTLLCRTIPSDWRPVEVLVDLIHYASLNGLALRLLWLLLVVDLWIVQGRGPLSILMVLGLYIAALIVPFASRRLFNRLIARPAGDR